MIKTSIQLLLCVVFAGVACHDSAAGPRTPPAAADASQLQEFSGLTLPSDAHDVVISSYTNAVGSRVFEARFATSEPAARGFCASFDLGGAMPEASALDANKREYFQVQGDSVRRPFGCASTRPENRSIQREVLVTLPSDQTAMVHVVAFRLAD
jgi:hypothetical protein